MSKILLDIWSCVIKFISDIRIYKWGLILAGDSSYKIKGPQQREVLNTLASGDVLLRRYSHFLGGLAVPGYWSHIAMYIGDNKVIHMTTTGLKEEDILTFLRCDDIMVLRCSDTNLTKTALTNAVELYKKKDDLKYDWLFDLKTKNYLYCSEMVSMLYNRPKPISIMKKGYLLPDDFLNIPIFTKAWENK